MAHLTWLHLSDWHQKGKDFDRGVVRDKLIEDLQKRVEIDPRLAKIDFVVFSGDLAYFGDPKEFEAARESLLDPVLNALSLTPDRLFMVPGNHDLQRSTISEFLPSGLQQPLKSDELVNKWLTNEKGLKLVLDPFEAYIGFVERYTGQPQPAFASVNRLSLNGIDVAILGLNSAWMCARNKKSDGEFDDYGQIVVGEPQIHDALQKISDATIRIVVLHHPFNWLQGFEQSKIQKRLKTACHFILRGHEHDPDADLSKGTQGECVIIPAGASYDRRNANDMRYVNSYNFVHLDLTKSRGVVFFRRWSEKQTKWIKDLDSCEDGQLVFELPKQLGSSSPTVTYVSSAATTPDQSALESEYRSQTIEAFKDLSFKGLTASVRPILLPLERVYVQLRAVAEVPESADEFTPEERRVLRWMDEEREEIEHSSDLREAHMRLDALRRERWTKDRLERFPIAEALKDPKRRGLVILGDPGSGKTTLLHFLALIFARGPQAASEFLKLTGDEADRLPIFAPLAAYDDMLNQDPSLTVQTFLSKYYAQRKAIPGLENLFNSAIEKGRALVLLDGMDEVLEEGRRKFVADQASAFIRALIHRGNRVLLTSRIYGYRVAPLSVDLPHVTVLDFRREEIEVFAKQWNGAMAEWEYADRSAGERVVLARDEERALLEEIQSNPGVERLAANPLLLSMLALLRRQVGRLPQQRIRLYALYLGTLIDAWEASRSPGARVDSPARPEAGRVELVLIPLALWLQQNKPSGTATEAEILAQITAVFLREEGLSADTPQDTPAWGEAHIRAQKFLQDMRRYSGLLVERGQGVFGFRHLTFQEYYVGRALARMDSVKRWRLLQANLHANRWREPILLAAAQLGNMQADEEACTIFVNQILDADSPHEDILHRDLFLGADCAADDINVHIKTLRRIVEELQALISSPTPALVSGSVQRIVGLALLSSAGKPRLPETIDILRMALPSDPSSKLFSFDKYITLVRPLLHLFPAISEFVIAHINSLDYYYQTEAIRALSGTLSDTASVREFVMHKLNDDWIYMQSAAIQAIAGLLSQDEALVELVKGKLDHDESTIRAAAIHTLAALLPTHPLLLQKVYEKLTDPDEIVRNAALQALSPLLSDNRTLVDAVVLTLNDYWYRVQISAIHTLAGVLSQYEFLRDHIAKRLDDGDEVAAAAAQALASFLPQDETLRSQVSLLLDDASPFARVGAIQALGDCLVHDSVVRDAVTRKLDDTHPAVREAAIQALLKIEQPECSVLSLLRHTDWRTRRDSVFAMSGFLTSETVVSAFAEALEDLQCPEAVAAQAAAVEALGGLATEDDSLHKLILEKLDDESFVIRSAAIRGISPLLSKDMALREAVIHKLADPDSVVRSTTIDALAPFLPETKQVIDSVVSMLYDTDYEVSTSAMRALVPIVNSDPELIAHIDRVLKTELFTKREALLLNLGPLVGTNPEIRALVAERLNDESYWVQAAAIKALGKSLLDEEKNNAIARFLREADDHIKASLVYSLTEFIPEDPWLTEAIKRMVKDPSDYLRTVAISVLAKLVPTDESVREAAVELLNDPQTHAQAQAIRSLSLLMSQESALRERIAEMLYAPRPLLRAAAVDALAGTLSQDESTHLTVKNLVDDPSEDVRASAIRALTGLLPESEQLRMIIAEKLEDESTAPLIAACEALIPFIADVNIRTRLLPALGMDDQETRMHTGYVSVREALVKSWGKWALTDPQGGSEAVSMLAAEDWRLRMSGVQILMVEGKDFVRQAKPQLLQVTSNDNGFDSFPARVAAAEALINHSKHCQKAIEVLMSALDYGAQPLAIVPMASDIRTSAAVALGKLKAEEYQPEVASKLRQFMQTERNPQVLDGLYNAILSLASAPINVE